MSETITPAHLIPDNDEQRLKKLHDFDILDTPAEHRFDKIAILAAQIFDAPIAQVTFVDKDRVFFKTNISPLEATEISRKDSFCSLAILNEQTTIFENMLVVPELINNPYVTMQNGVRFYAGAPLKTAEGFRLGTVCVLDTTARTVTPKQLAMLETLSSIVMDELELRLTTRKALRTQTDMMNRVIHDLKNPNTTISLSAELIKRKAEDPKLVANFAERIKTAADHVLSNLNNLLDISQIENGSFRLQIEEVDVLTILESTKQSLDLIAKQKNQIVQINCNCPSLLLADAKRLQEAFDNLLSNALKYSDRDTKVDINVSRNNDMIIIEFKDYGQGLTADDMQKLFTKFARLSAVPTGREHSNGIGLSIVKMLIELHQGKVYAKSEGKNKGASFFIELSVN